tara:strand:- start:877 stop:1452 length:576 start_codon:yes stop_codon:yes gene_type:complete
MALQTSGMISLNDIHIEAGGTTGTIVSLNDSDIRGLTAASGYTINGTSGTSIDFGDFYGASGSLDTQTVTVGYQAGSQYVGPSYGYTTISSTNFGSCSDATSDLYSGAAVQQLMYFLLTSSYHAFVFVVAGNRANSGWTTLAVGGESYLRSAATYSYNSNSNFSRWEWDDDGTGTNPMGTTAGATKEVVFT